MAKNWGEPICKVYVDIGWPLLESVGVWWCLMLRQIAKFCERTVFCPVLLHISFCSNFHLWSRLALWWGKTLGLGWMTKKWPSYLILTQLPGHGGTLNSTQLKSTEALSTQLESSQPDEGRSHRFTPTLLHFFFSKPSKYLNLGRTGGLLTFSNWYQQHTFPEVGTDSLWRE